MQVSQIEDMLSILLPSYNNYCLPLVKNLQRQASAIEGLQYEVIVADDGGTDLSVKQQNAAINDVTGCRYIIREKNVGRAAIRNFLASQAQYEWLLFIDSDICITNESFILNYVVCPKDDVICGGVNFCIDEDYKLNLRYRYEHAEESKHSEINRNRSPFASFRTTNFMIRKSVMDKLKFDERFIKYGYEDVMYGRNLKENGYNILHINNPVTYTHFETNIVYVRKVEEALSTLHSFRTELEGYSPLIELSMRLHSLHLQWLMRLWHTLFYSMEKRNLIGNHPSLFIFKLYKLGYYMSLK